MTGRIHALHRSDGGVPKHPVTEAEIGHRGIVGDRQADTRHHGSPDQALCVWSWEVIAALRDEGHPISPGFAGENVTIEGIDWTRVRPGTTLLLGTGVVAPVTWPAAPCAKNAAWFIDRDFRRMSDELHPGWSRMYTSVTVPGHVAIGDVVRLSEG